MRDLMITVLSSTTIIFASYVNFLRFNEYPLLRYEVLIVTVGILALTTLISLLHRSQEALGRSILEGFLVFFVFDQNNAGILYSTLAGATVIGIVLYRKKSTLPFLGTAAFITLLTNIMGIGSAPLNDVNKLVATDRREAHSTDLEKHPALLYVILDEHIGIEGLPHENTQTLAMKKELQDFYISRGFRLYGRAYSEHLHTVNSIPQILNFGETQSPVPKPMDGLQVSRNSYFDFLHKRGYRINVLQSDFVDYCSHRSIVDCETYSYANLSALSQAPISIGQRAKLIAMRYFILSPTARNFGYLYLHTAMKLSKWGIVLPSFGLQSGGEVSSLNAFLTIDRYTKKLENAEAGDVFFVHTLSPHYPYIMTPDCRIISVDSWRRRHAGYSRNSRENSYFDQIKCVNKKLDAALVALERSPARDNFVVIVHGDHGSRITSLDPTVENKDSFSDADMIAGFSTLFAVRGSGVKAGYVNQAAPVSMLLKNFSENEFLTSPVVPQAVDGLVTLDDENWQPRSLHSLPRNWLSSK
ncbi:sulfatase-like hydrolase/transferase [Parasphingorhabdus sp.]|uniref:sulfatase-like hydrolase/transferase n=1 Tax=Parasphingorhabdus sp. TaxID=2709688 RepID=UPI002F959922